MALSSDQLPKHRPLQVAVACGMPVCTMGDGTLGNIIGVTEAYCIYRLHDADTICVANWRDIAIGNVCPSPTLLPTNVADNDRRNTGALVLRDLLGLQQVAPLTPTQNATLEELVDLLCEG